MRKISQYSAYRIIFIVLCIVCAFIAGKADYVTVLSDKSNLFFGMLRASIYIFLFAAWGISVRYRIVSKKVRILLALTAGLMIFWFFVRTAKYFMIENMTARRICWYFYYVALLFIIFLAIFIIHAIGKPSDYHFTKAFYAPFLITVVLSFLAITNDYHQLVFDFPDNAVVWTDFEYTYGIGYFLILGWIVICVCALLIELIRKYRNQIHYRAMLLPFIPIVLSLGYCYLYAHGSFLTKYIFSDITTVLCLTVISVYECCIGAGFIPVNLHYNEFFENSRIPIYLLSRDHSLFLASKNAPELKESYIEESLEIPVMLDRKSRLSSSVINGGFVFWIDDVSETMDVVNQLQDVNETLTEKHMVVQERYRTRKEKLHLEESNRLYNYMQIQTSAMLFRMDELREKIKTETDKNQERKLLYEMIVIGIFFKRRNNLLFISESEQVTGLGELQYCLNEILSSIELNGTKTSSAVRVKEEMSIFTMMDIVDHFYEVIMNTLFHLKSIAVVIDEDRDGYILQMNATLNQPLAKNVLSDFEIEQEEGEEVYLFYRSTAKEEV